MLEVAGHRPDLSTLPTSFPFFLPFRSPPRPYPRRAIRPLAPSTPPHIVSYSNIISPSSPLFVILRSFLPRCPAHFARAPPSEDTVLHVAEGARGADRTPGRKARRVVR